MINVYDWSYDIERSIVRITFHEPIANKIIQVAEAQKARLLTNVKCAENELYFGLRTSVAISNFITALAQKYPNSFTLKNDWDISQTDNSTVSFSCLVEPNMNIIEDIVASMFDDFRFISSMTKRKTSNFELNVDGSIAYMTFDIIFSTQDEARTFIYDYNRFKK